MGHFSHTQDAGLVRPPAEIGILPIFPDKSTDPTLLKHSMLFVKAAIEFLNPGQTPVLGADQPISAVYKQLQIQYHVLLGEDKFVIMMGGLHVQDKSNLMLGKLIRGSGW